MPTTLTIATRESALALWQAEHIQARLEALHPGLEVRLLGMTTEGDRRLGSSLAKIGGKGLFVKELEAALLDGRADLAVHSMKDVPMHLPEGFVLGAVPAREDPRDAFVSNDHAALDALPQGACVGTSSLRREALLRHTRPDLRVEPLRGNVQTRLRKLDDGAYDAIVLATAGLKRLGLDARIRAPIAPEASLPAVGQGALGIEIRADRADVAALIAALDDADTRWCVEAERAMSRALGGSCTVPLGGYAQRDGAAVRLRGFVATPDGRTLLRAEATVAHAGTSPDALGQAVAAQLEAQGARAVLAAGAAS
jgi:hydroxymethylbilane synthase